MNRLLLLVLMGVVMVGCSGIKLNEEVFNCLDEEEINFIMTKASSFNVDTKDPDYSCEKLHFLVRKLMRAYQ